MVCKWTGRVHSCRWIRLRQRPSLPWGGHLAVLEVSGSFWPFLTYSAQKNFTEPWCFRAYQRIRTCQICNSFHILLIARKLRSRRNAWSRQVSISTHRYLFSGWIDFRTQKSVGYAQKSQKSETAQRGGHLQQVWSLIIITCRHTVMHSCTLEINKTFWSGGAICW